MPPPLQPDEEEDEEYESSQDSDFAPDAAGGAEGDEEDASDSEDETTPATTTGTTTTTTASATKRKRAASDAEAEDAGIENSGDEAIITKGQKRRKRHQQQTGAAANDDDEEGGGEGGVVKTRSMRAQAKAERKVAAVQGPVTIDVDAVWAQMMAGPARPAGGDEREEEKKEEEGMNGDAPAAAPARQGEKETGATAGDMIKIKRTYNFAGKVHTEEKLVARDSAEAKLYFASLGKQPGVEGGGNAEEDEAPPQRVLKKAFRSAFEPVMELVAAKGGRADLNLGVRVAIQARESKAAAAKKLNTVEKSRMDWAGYVDQEGLKDELELAGRSKDSYNVREGFLARSEARREEDAWKVRMAGKAA